MKVSGWITRVGWSMKVGRLGMVECELWVVRRR